MNLIDEIVPRLSISGVLAAQNSDVLASSKITHVLSLDSSPNFSLTTKHDEKYVDASYNLSENCLDRKPLVHKFICCEDSVNQNLLQHFNECIDFIDQALTDQGNDNRVLVHCVAGISRSATIVTAYLMKSRILRPNEALSIIRMKRPVQPNYSFLFQLKLFHHFNFVVDINCSVYKAFNLNSSTKLMFSRYSLPDFRSLATEICANDPIYSSLKTSFTENTNNNSNGTESAQERCVANALFRCKKCSRVLFQEHNLLKHILGKGYFNYRNDFTEHSLPGNDAPDDDTEVCDLGELYIEPIKWMAEDIHRNEGKLYCPQCRVKIGSFKWSGDKCLCQTWIVPCFHILKQRVDLISLPTQSQ